jgi:prepilin-type N-terminal cleavage/methylation domain-containing protein
MRTNCPKSGFTIIELLIVITIIGILTAILVPILNVQEYLKQSRDARRVNDILTIQTALSAALADGTIRLTDTTGCTTCNSIDGTTSVDGTGWVPFTEISGRGMREYLSVLPKDPVNQGSLKFDYYSDGIRFELNAKLESEKYQIYMIEDGGNEDELYERGWDLELK